MPKWGEKSEPKIRIVDMNGKAHSVTTRVPEMNAQALRMSQVNDPITQTFTPKSPKTPIISQQPKTQNYQDLNIANAQATNAYPQSNPVVSEAPTNSMTSVKNNSAEEVVEMDLSESSGVASESSKKVKYNFGQNKTTPNKAISSSAGNKFFVQVGSYSNISTAESELKKMKKFHSGKIETVDGERTMHRVLVGPFSNKNKAAAMMKKIKASGHDAIITRGE